MTGVDQLLAVQQITCLKARFLRAVDSGSAELLATTLAPEVLVDFRGASTDPLTGVSFSSSLAAAPISGRDQVVSAMAKPRAGRFLVHHVSAPEIEILSAQRASAIWPMSDRVTFREEDQLVEMIGFGYYHDTYICGEGGWQIAELRLARTRLSLTRSPAA